MPLDSTASLRHLKVLHVIPSISPSDGGPSNAMVLIERALGAAKVEVTTLTTNHGRRPGPGLNHDPLNQTPAKRIYVHKWTAAYKFAPAAVGQLAGIIRRYDAVHIHALFSFTSTAAAWAARAARVPYIVRPLGTLSSYGLSVRRRRLKQLSMSLIENAILRHAAAIHYTSNAERQEAEQLGIRTKSIVIPLAADLNEGPFTASLRSELSISSRRKVVLFLSRLDPKKNLEALIDALAYSNTLKATSTLLIAGSGEPSYVLRLKSRAAAAGLGENTIWLGQVDGDQKAAAFAAADVFVLPSHSENFGIAAAEALLAGKPCILARGVAIANEAERAGAALAVTAEPILLARALERLLADSELRRQMGLRAREFAGREYSARTMAQRLIALYEEVRLAPKGRRS
jgi:glycosyltransferase involved in cell wall biosynthesis